jgi:hypothetical protein
VRPAWRGSDQPDNVKRTVWTYTDGTNTLKLYFIQNRTGDGFTGWVFSLEPGGYEVKIDTSVIDVLPDLPIDLIIRFSDTTMNLFLLGMDAADEALQHVYASGEGAYVLTLVDPGSFERGSASSAEYFGGWIKMFRTSAQIPSDAEITRFIR